MVSSNACRVLFFLSLSLGGASARTLSQATEPTVNIGSAGNYAILTKTGISTVPKSAVTGDIAVSPIAATAVTGFDLSADSTNEFSTTTQVTGKVFAANYAAPIPSHLTSAVQAMELAYTDAAGRANADPARKDLNAGTLGGAFGGEFAKLTPGVYTFGSAVTIAETIYFDGGADDVFIIQIADDLRQIKFTQVLLSGGAQAKNIFWQVAGAMQVGKGAHMEGIVMVKTDVLFENDSSLTGRVFAQTACNLQKATITQA